MSLSPPLPSPPLPSPPAQNNNRGGYNAGDQDTGAFDSEDEIYYMVRPLKSDIYLTDIKIRYMLDDAGLWDK